jgi:small subunit ribosomal protein S9
MTSVIQYYGTGRRKCAAARVRLVPGTGEVMVNGRTMAEYLGGRYGFDKTIMTPFEAADAMGRFDALISVCGGGISGQVDAIRHGIARALAAASPQARPVLRTGSLLTRDSRVKERKKYGRKRARKRFQFSKR